MRVLATLATVVALASAAFPQEGTVDGWIDELRAEDAIAREGAVRGLVAHGEDAVPALESLIADAPGPAVEWAARRAYGAIVGLSPELARDIEDRLQTWAAEEHPDVEDAARWLVSLGDAAVDHARARMDDDGSWRVSGLEHRLVTLSAVAALADGRNRDDAAARALADLGEIVIEDLAEVVDADDVPDAWRAVAAERLVALGGGEAQQPALDLLDTDAPVVREILLPYFAVHGDVELFEAVAATAARFVEREPALERHLLAYGERLADDALRPLLDARPEGVRAVAATLVGRRRDTEARDRLRRLVTRDDDAGVVAAALVALGKVGEDDDLSAFARRLADERPGVRRAAVDGLAVLGGDTALAWIAATLADPDASVRVRATTSLAESEADAAVDPLIAALSDADPGVLAAATRGLSRLTGESFGALASVSTDRQRRAVRSAWERWSRERHDVDEVDDDDDAGDEDDEATVARYAADGGRILEDLARVLQRSFRPYGALEEQEVTSTENLVAAAVRGMTTLLEREEDPDDPDLPTLALDDEGRAVLAHLVEHGRFERPADLGRMVGSLPVELVFSDYVMLTYGAAEAMVDSLGDRFTRLSVLEDAEGEVDEDLLPVIFGKGRSIGMMFERDESGATVEFVFALSPADRAGLRRGDRVISIGGDLVTGLDEAQLQRRLEEPVDLLVLRDGWTNPVSFHLEPEPDDPEALVTTTVLPGRVGYLRLRAFEPACAQQVEWALRELETQGIDALVFDLRGNPGGTIVDAAAIVDKFVGEGELITTNIMNGSGDESVEEEVRSTDSDTDREYPLAVLVDGCSASASEMTSGALQDLERAVIVGRTSWGKGIGQSSDGVVGFTRDSVFGETTATLGLSITVLEYLLPSGRSIQGVGVEPDVSVALPSLLGERFELGRRVERDARTLAYVDALIEDDRELALRLAHYDAWDPTAYPDLDELESELDLELSTTLFRAAVRRALRDRLRADGAPLHVDVQEDEDVRAAVAAIAEATGLDLASTPAYEDLAD